MGSCWSFSWFDSGSCLSGPRSKTEGGVIKGERTASTLMLATHSVTDAYFPKYLLCADYVMGLGMQQCVDNTDKASFPKEVTFH